MKERINLCHSRNKAQLCLVDSEGETILCQRAAHKASTNGLKEMNTSFNDFMD